tara:strand:+ start:523 stop:651 length:129 start_codon:yes stop_codon:yes gene_type:complete
MECREDAQNTDTKEAGCRKKEQGVDAGELGGTIVARGELFAI